MKIEIRWRKSTDEGYPRRRVVEIEIPVERPTTPLEDAVLALPGTHLDGVCIRSESGQHYHAAPQINAALEEPPTDQDCVEAIEVAVAAARAEAEEADAKHEQEEAEKNAKAVEDARQYVSTGKSNLWQHDMDRLAHVDPDLVEQVRAEQVRQEKVKEADRADRTAKQIARNEAREKKEEADKDARQQDKLTWIEGHGSTRLRQQIKAGLDGWPLYLHERLEEDLPGWELDNDGTDGTLVVNPSEDAVRFKLETAEALVELELTADVDDALGHLSILRIEFPDDQTEHEYYDERTPEGVYLVCDCYQPGRHPSWSIKRVRIAVTE